MGQQLDNPSIQSRLWPFYGYYFFSFLLPLYGVYILIVEGILKSDILTASLIAVWCVTVVALEIPSGALADYWNKKKVLAVSQFAQLGSVFVWMLAPNFYVLMIGFVLWGITESFRSGSVEAMLYEELDRSGELDDYQKISGRCRFLMTLGITLAVLSGSVLKEIRPQWVFYTSLLTGMIGLACCMVIPYHHTVRVKSQGIQAYLKIMLRAFKQIMKSSLLQRLLLYCIVYFSIVGSIEEFLQLWLKEQSIKGLLFGTMLTLIMLAQTIGAGISSLFKIGKWREGFLYSGMGICGVLLIWSHWMPVIAIPLMILVFMITSIMETKLEAVIQDEIQDQRVTILSINSFAMNSSAILFTLVIGFLSENNGYIFTFSLLGLLVLVCAGILMICHRNQSPRQKNNALDGQH